MLKVVRGPAAGAALPLPARRLYERLLQDPAAARAPARRYLHECLDRAQMMPDALPAHPRDLHTWSREGSVSVSRQYREYLDARKAGQARRFFSRKSHALYFLRGVAPTKLVDGAWLYGTLAHWRDERFLCLIRTYLEELGDGRAEQNHVLLYRRLLARHDCADWRELSDEHFIQGAIQLSLAQLGDEFLPEVLGYNLGYEQLPLHLLITSYELNELGIDPYYFTLHVTIDNAASGHAYKAVQSVLDLLPAGEASAVFYRRVAAGYRLNELGASTTSVIAGFDLERELVRAFSTKAEAGAELHSDYCRIGGASVNEWLREPERIPDFLRVLQQEGWIRRGAPVEESRFWRLIDGAQPAMFGVFNRYDKQLLRDWITGATPREPSFRARSRLAGKAHAMAAEAADVAGSALPETSFDSVAKLVPQLSPTRHHTPEGLAATRLFAQILEQR